MTSKYFKFYQDTIKLKELQKLVEKAIPETLCEILKLEPGYMNQYSIDNQNLSLLSDIHGLFYQYTFLLNP